MAVNAGPSLLRATAVFNPTASVPGFLVPIFPGFDGDNRAYVQRYRRPESLLGFTETSWPDEGSVDIPPTLAVAIGDESIWAFAFPGEEPLVLPWRLFRSEMRRRIEDPCFGGRPGLLFDVVEGLDIEEAKGSVFLAAFEAYERHGRAAAERWRDRSILEPTLQKAIAERIEAEEDDGSQLLTASLSNGELSVELRYRNGEIAREQIVRTYEALAERHPKLFPRQVAFSIVDRMAPTPTGKASDRRTVVAIHGRLSGRGYARERWLERNIEVVDAEDLKDVPKRAGERRQVVFVSALADWNDRSPRAFDAESALAVLMTTTMSPLASEDDMRVGSSMPTLVTFAPYGTSKSGGDPVAMISRLIVTIAACWEKGEALLPAAHNSLVREARPPYPDALSTACGLLGRALRVQAPVDAPARLVLDRRLPHAIQADLGDALRSTFPSLETFVVEPSTPRSRPVPMLFVARPTTIGEGRENLRKGVTRLLTLRGWHVEDERGGLLRARDDTHDFSVAIARHNDEVERSSSPPDRPSFGRASMLVVHENPRREWLLAGNLGHFFHVALEDIALMVPETKWVWPILRRQLRGKLNRRSDTAAKLLAAIAAEALAAGRYQDSIVKFDPDHALRLLLAPDCLEQVRLASDELTETGAQLVLGGMKGEFEPYLKIHIHDDGPFVEVT